MSIVILSLIVWGCALMAGNSVQILRPHAFLLGCAFSVLNIIFYRYVSAAVLAQRSSVAIVIVVLLKAPVLIALLWLLVQQSAAVIVNVLVGVLIFIPASLAAAVVSRTRPHEDEGTPWS